MKTDFPTGSKMDAMMDKLLSVSHDELKRRMNAYKKQAALNLNKRGPKPKRTLSEKNPA